MFTVPGWACWVWVQGLGCMVQVLGFMFQRVRFKGLGFRV